LIPSHGFDITGPLTAPNIDPDRAIGNMSAGTYQYKITYTNRYGETTSGPASVVVTPISGSVLLTNIPVHPQGNVTLRNIYRTAVGVTLPFRLIGSIGDNITTSFTDISSDADLGVPEPINNFAPSIDVERGWTVMSRPTVHPFDNVITAAGSSYGTATRCNQTSEYILVNVPLDLNGIILPPITPNLVGLVITVKNTSGANQLNVYPEDPAGTINIGGPGVPRVLQPGVVEELLALTLLNWQVITSTGGAGGGVTTFDGGITGLTPAVPTGGTVSLGGTLNVAHGGTGLVSVPSGSIIYGNDTAALGTSLGLAGQLFISGGTSAPGWSGAITYTGGTITGVPTPVNNLDIVNKAYVDAATTGLNIHTATRLATTADLGATYNNGVSGVGATLTGGLVALTIDTKLVAPGDRILVKNQTTQAQNGVYDVSVVGSGIANWVLTRSFDFDNSPPGEVKPGDYVFVTDGFANLKTGWTQTEIGTGPGQAIIIGTDAIKFTQFSGAGTYSAGTGLSLTGTVFDNTGVLSNSGGTTGLTFTPATGNSVLGGILAVANGGTGTTAGVDVVLDGSAAPKYPQDLTSGVWYGTGTKAAGNSSSIRIGNSASATGSNSIAIGTLTSAQAPDSIAIGVQSTTGPSSRTIMIGACGGTLSTGVDNIGLGYGICGSLTTGSANIGIGYSPLSSLSTGSNNIGIGYYSLKATTNAGSNTAVGNYTMNSNINGSANVAVGYSALQFGTLMVQSVAIGASCLNVCSGSYNTAVGANAGLALDSGTNNVLIGCNTNVGTYPSAISDSVVIGSGSTTAGSNDISINSTLASTGGSNIALRGAVSSGSQSIAIGGTCSGSTAVSVGQGSTASANNSVSLGSGALASAADAIAIGLNTIANVAGGIFVRHRGPAAFTVNAAGFIAGTNELVEVSSSIKTKENIRTLESTVETFSKLRPVRYTPKLVGGLLEAEIRENIGLIAEEVVGLYPEVVTFDAEKQPAGLMYDRLVPVLIEQVQSQHKEIQELRSLIVSLQNDMNAILEK
jgi:hypothetical protein